MRIVRIIIGLFFVGALYLHMVTPAKKQTRKKNQHVLYNAGYPKLKWADLKTKTKNKII